jgi:predicted RNase H-like HicB family nuclease
MKQNYVVVFEQTPNNYCAYVPDLPGCISTGRTWDDMLAMIKEAIEFHIEGLQLHGDPVPRPQMSVEEALAYHRSLPNDYGGYFPAPDDREEEDPVAILEVEVEVNLQTAPATPAD